MLRNAKKYKENYFRMNERWFRNIVKNWWNFFNVWNSVNVDKNKTLQKKSEEFFWNMTPPIQEQCQKNLGIYQRPRIQLKPSPYERLGPKVSRKLFESAF